MGSRLQHNKFWGDAYIQSVTLWVTFSGDNLGYDSVNNSPGRGEWGLRAGPCPWAQRWRMIDTTNIGEGDKWSWEQCGKEDELLGDFDF